MGEREPDSRLGVKKDGSAVSAALDLDAELARHHTESFGWALACCNWDRDEAEDVLQTAYLKVLEGRALFGGRSSFRTWLFGVIRTTAAEQRRRDWRRRMSWLRRMPVEGWSASSQVTASAETELDATAEADQLRQALLALPARQREVLHLVFYADLSIGEAAAIMGVALGTARTHYERGKRRLRLRMAGEDRHG